MSEHIIDLYNITKSYGDTEVIKDLTLYIRKNEFLTLLGPSGCGKTTTLRIIGGFEQPDSGRIFFNNVDITDVPPHKRPINTVFQKYSLFPHMNIYENIAFGLRIKKMKEKEIKEKVARVLELVELSGFEKRMPHSLSGGQQQRIAIARAIVNEPEVLLLDEPLGALDLKLRKEMQYELKNLQKKTGITFVYVTHDQEEALTMSDTIIVMNHGVIQQIGKPTDIYNEPSNAFVAQFIGESNILSGVMKRDYLCEFANKEFQCEDKGFGEDEDVDVVVRPEDIKIVEPEKGMLQGEVLSTLFKGVHYEIIVEANGFKWKIHTTAYSKPGSKVGLSIDPYDIHIMRIPYNIMTGWMVEDNKVEIVDSVFDCNASGFEQDETVSVYILPQDIEIKEKDFETEMPGGTIKGEIVNVKDKGLDYEVIVKCSDTDFLVHTDRKMAIGTEVCLFIPKESIKIRKRVDTHDKDEMSVYEGGDFENDKEEQD
ncbi:MAG: ABC transporter ATP-binding protein [Clostridiaceae bacterium]|nr:ABC transporter ATP-binding protein [Clostridiaceae bacterium]